ncbi:bifunctional demethylmenaquinone methyltransferase/2-methoxy-6-polyprenyl-1,4-benzoquinol methylase UbiE [Coriobacteriia bacterium Es71-Z0120]|uniref:bifunctional demethylmenaquinone methyltransferase/2-methoxy-6-polyprenyl-1,4-benzoquinol methylase UbiE n=1 Tax=Parvivirga hydrogeniphila TaxID=2939460 RepID=UPI002260A85A|nr:bifunctional demethylmenaquinone methyltransferase/2-methoxy-6-polyprenyl-1,4-benzoquinol methylase UbiE [Parvivirga hydrogeniphila]MCL4079317.1 bifunctional demethylmenaquinone methyltransferase/2-methoxy-6-polyprenyl-1,4-benzoquinol methylase UbiE [Parvivirga hydrogeniphila]
MSEALDPSRGTPTTERVRGIFSRIAPRYDAFNLVSSFGLDRLWRRATVRMAGITPSTEVLDLAAGTGDLTLAIARYGRPASVLSTDFVEEMLRVGKQKAARYHGPTRISFAHADAQALPFSDASFDVVTIAFGVRNLPDRQANFREVRRVLRSGGRYVILEFSRPPFAPFRAVYHAYLERVIPALGALIAGDRASFEYLNASIRRFPSQQELARELEAAGFSRVRWRNLTGGIVAVHVAEV